jgi:hypothetical protein
MQFASAKHLSSQFWSTGYAWGTLRQEPVGSENIHITLHVLHGRLELDVLKLAGDVESEMPCGRIFTEGDIWQVETSAERIGCLP